MKLRDINKLVALVLLTVSVTLLAIYQILDAQAVVALLGAMIGYVLGNGHGAIENKMDIAAEIKKVYNGGSQ